MHTRATHTMAHATHTRGGSGKRGGCEHKGMRRSRGTHRGMVPADMTEKSILSLSPLDMSTMRVPSMSLPGWVRLMHGIVTLRAHTRTHMNMSIDSWQQHPHGVWGSWTNVADSSTITTADNRGYSGNRM